MSETVYYATPYGKKTGALLTKAMDAYEVQSELLALLDEAATAIEEEVSAGDDDHPIIRAHRKTAEKVRAAIAKAKGSK